MSYKNDDLQSIKDSLESMSDRLMDAVEDAQRDLQDIMDDNDDKPEIDTIDVARELAYVQDLVWASLDHDARDNLLKQAEVAIYACGGEPI
jgi:hypothetical protein